MSVGYPWFLMSFEDNLSYTKYDANDSIIGTGNLSLTSQSNAGAVSYETGIFGKCFRTNNNKAAIEISNNLLGTSNQYSVDFWLKDINSVHGVSNTAAFRFNFPYNTMLLGFYQGSTSPDRYTQGIYDYDRQFIAVGVDRNGWHHYAFQFNQRTCTVYVDGISKGSITHESWTLSSLFFGGNVDRFFTDIALDELRICNGLVYTGNFNPFPSSMKKLYKSSTNKVYGFNNGIFGQVVQDWSLLTDTEKESTFESYGKGIPTSANYSSINENFNILVYSNNSENYTATLNAVPTPKVILPDNLMVMTSYSHVDSAIFTYTQSGNGVIKALVTLDLENYYAYRNNEFELVSISNISTSGNTLLEINSIPEEDWHIFTEGLDGIAFAYYIAQQSTTDVARIDQLQIQADGVGEWVSSVHGTDFTYKYTSNTEMSVTIINAGDYKINYPR